jgi:alpha-methylacyl-CoA racemase
MLLPPLTGIRVIELAGLAPGLRYLPKSAKNEYVANWEIGPFAGMMIADAGASVLRIDKPIRFKGEVANHPTPDLLTRHKGAIAVDMKSPHGIELIKELAIKADILIDPFRPGVLEKLGLGPKQMLSKLNPRLIIARMTGFRRDGLYSRMAGHDINYLAVSGVLSMLGRDGEKPYPPANLLGDFGGGGLMLVCGILQALYSREKSGKGQIVEVNMVDGVAYLATMPRLGIKTPMWEHPRGQNTLDGGCPYYDTYETSDGGFMAV